MKLLFNPLSFIVMMLGGFLLFVEYTHTQAHIHYEHDVHGHVKQFCRSNLDACQRIVSDLE